MGDVQGTGMKYDDIVCFLICVIKYNRQKQMNYSYKLKIRQMGKQGKQQSSIRRIRTDYLENKKTTGGKPLTENKKLFNQPTSNVQLKTKKTVIKSNSNNPGSRQSNRLTTEPHDKFQYQHQKNLSDKLYNPKKVSTITSYSFKKKQNCIASKGQKEKGPASKSDNEPKKGASKYQVECKVGSGTFGTVFKARDKTTLDVVAIKKVFQDKNYKNRQLQILKMLKHPNVLEMKDSFFTYEGDKEYLNVVMDYYGCNLYEFIHKYSRKNPIPRLPFKLLAYQLIRSLLYLRKLSISHRDIKPQNILINEQNNKLVLCDFGSAKQLKPSEPNISYICSRCYRAPELIFGFTQYTTQVDMWSIGCVIGEMIGLKPLFQGDSNIDQLVQIIKLLGCPSNKEILEMNPDYDVTKFQLPKISGKSWEKIFPSWENLGEGFIDLMKNILCYSPHKRYTPLQALQHPFFDQIRDKNTYLQLKVQIPTLPDLFTFNQSSQGPECLSLIPKWYPQ